MPEREVEALEVVVGTSRRGVCACGAGSNIQEAEAMEIVFMQLYLQLWGRAPSPLAKRQWEHGNMELKEEPHRAGPTGVKDTKIQVNVDNVLRGPASVQRKGDEIRRS